MLSPILGKACKELGIPQGMGIQAHAYKLLIYEQGAMFRPHTDTEKVPGMFGTLVDVSGLKRSLKNWSASKTGPVVHILEHKYTDASLRLSAMKGADHSRVMALQRFAGKYKYNMFLRSLEHERSGTAEDEYDPYDRRRGWYDDDDDECGDNAPSRGEYHVIEEVIDEKTTLNRVVVTDEAGTEILADIGVDDDEPLWDEAFTGVREPDEHEYEGYTGNAGAQATHWCEQQDSAEDKAQAKSDLCEACIYVTQQNNQSSERNGRRPFPADVCEEVINILLQLGNYDALVAAVASSADQLSSAAFKILAPLIDDHFDRLGPALTKAFDRFHSIHNTFESLKILFDGELSGRAGPIGDWITHTIKRALNGIVQPEEQDGSALAEIVICFKGLMGTSELIKRRTAYTNFMLAFLAGLVKKGHEAFSPAEVLSIVNQFLGPVLDGFLPTIQPIADHKRMKTDTNATANAPKPRSSTAPASDIVQLPRYLLQNDMRTEVESLFKDNIDNDYAPSFQNLYLGVFEACINECVKEQPPPFQSWADTLKKTGAPPSVGLTPRPNPPGPAAAMTPASASAGPSSHAGTKKRKIEVIDLLSD
ncbi:hypothetical protein BST61_g4270 [Cercospora zeina]